MINSLAWRGILNLQSRGYNLLCVLDLLCYDGLITLGAKRPKASIQLFFCDQTHENKIYAKDIGKMIPFDKTIWIWYKT